MEKGFWVDDAVYRQFPLHTDIIDIITGWDEWKTWKMKLVIKAPFPMNSANIALV